MAPTLDRSVACGFDFTEHIRQLCDDFIARLPDLAHVDLSRVSICFSQARKSVRHGLQASLTPMRFERGAATMRRGRRNYTVQRLYDESGLEMLYILRFYLPRFLDLSLSEKLATIVHELWHISPAFDGDLRRHDGRCYAHGPSQKAFDAHAEHLVRRWQDRSPPAELYEFLRHDFHDLERIYGGVYGRTIPLPKLIPVDEGRDAWRLG
jgi:hypothetical protein